jgi:hypothetical protein
VGKESVYVIVGAVNLRSMGKGSNPKIPLRIDVSILSQKFTG